MGARWRDIARIPSLDFRVFRLSPQACTILMGLTSAPTLLELRRSIEAMTGELLFAFAQRFSQDSTSTNSADHGENHVNSGLTPCSSTGTN
jgi:hypothetical protein